MVTVTKLCELIWGMEKEEALFEWRISGVAVWKLVRMRLYMRLAMALGLFGVAHGPPRSRGNKLRRLGSLVWNGIVLHPGRVGGEREFLVFESGRQGRLDGKVVDMYMYSLSEVLPKSRSLTIQRHTSWDRSHSSAPNLATSHFAAIASALGWRLPLTSISNFDRSLILRLEERIFEATGLRLDLERIVRRELTLFRVQRRAYAMLFKTIRPRCIFIVCSYSREALIAAARAQQIKVVELQHGTIDRYHLGYNFPGQETVDYLPDAFLSFGSYWMKKVHFPLSTDAVVVAGYPFFTRQRISLSATKKSNTIVFISQGTIGKRLSAIACEVAEMSGDFRVVYKLHPGESGRWREEYPWLEASAQAGKLALAGDGEGEGLHELLAGADYQCGVYSTALYEGIALGCKTILLSLPGSEYMLDLIQDGYALQASNAADIHRILELRQHTRNNPSRDLFFHEPPLEVSDILNAVLPNRATKSGE